MTGDIRDPEAVARALQRHFDAVIHLVALVGVGQSMYQIAEYTSVNNLGTAIFCKRLPPTRWKNCCRFQHEYLWRRTVLRRGRKDSNGTGSHTGAAQDGDWEIEDPLGRPLVPAPTPEDKTPCAGLGLCALQIRPGAVVPILGTSLRNSHRSSTIFQYVWSEPGALEPLHGRPEQFCVHACSTGILPLIFEDGLQKRDFVSVYDVARACRLALRLPPPTGQAFNISSGVPDDVKEVAERTIAPWARPYSATRSPEIIGPEISGTALPTICRAKAFSGGNRKSRLEQGLEDLAEWLEGQTAIDRGMEARLELAARGLMV